MTHPRATPLTQATIKPRTRSGAATRAGASWVDRKRARAPNLKLAGLHWQLKRDVVLLVQVVSRYGNEMVGDVARDHHLRLHVLDSRGPHQLHTHLQLILQDVDDTLHPILPVGSRPHEHRAPNPNGFCPQSNGLKNVASTPDPPVTEDRELVQIRPNPPQRIHNLHQHLNSRPGKIKLPATMVGDYNTIHSRSISQNRILPGLNSLQHDLHARLAAEPRQILPVQRGVDEGRDGSGGTLALVNLG
mmetsp:Transcript_42260/g.92187  ORF Transcript_42260/g.92187 Transcript_42260/m.92187 type:complete len:246 (-) Transcript_42260:907-1644(-)